MEEIHFLGHIVSKNGVRMDPAKIEAIVSWPDLKTVHDVGSFPCLCYYYRRFVRHFAEIASPLHALEKKAIKWQWTSKEKSAFRCLKEKMTTDPVLVLPDLSKSFVVQCDACGNSIGAVLMQNGRVVAYESRILSDTEKTYHIYEKELLACPYLASKPHILVSYLEGFSSNRFFVAVVPAVVHMCALPRGYTTRFLVFLQEIGGLAEYVSPQNVKTRAKIL
ncbi:hypothetical protein L7F22_066428 [Adiantum nelumboides]|nr:hypothetical protein [Adiantum nelumboides]